MSKQSNKVKFGLKNCHYAKATFDEDGSVTYAKPVRIPGAVSLSMDANGEIEPFYADNIAYYVVNNNSGYEGDLEIALIPESFLTDIMHEELDGNGVLAENANVELEHFAFLFEFDGDQRHIRHVLYNCVASRPSIEGETNEDSKEVKTDPLNLQSTPLANGYVKAKTGTNTTDDVYNKWYDAVYEPQAEAVDTEDTGHTEEPAHTAGLWLCLHYYKEVYDYEEDFSFVRSDHRSGAGCLLVPHHPHRLHGREDQLRSDPGNHHPERQAQLLHSLCAEHPQGQQQAAG